MTLRSAIHLFNRTPDPEPPTTDATIPPPVVKASEATCFACPHSHERHHAAVVGGGCSALGCDCAGWS